MATVDPGAVAAENLSMNRLMLPLLTLLSCSTVDPAPRTEEPFVVVLGIAQDGGYPQAGCNRPHCQAGWEGQRRHVTSLGIVDPASGERWLIDATPDFPLQLRMLDELVPPQASPGLAGIFLTHAHVGHYAGLLHLGREIIGARDIAVHAMPRMKRFLETNGPWDQLVKLSNIRLVALEADRTVRLNERISITPFLVPHRDEYSETVGYRITGPAASVLFIPDIDKWEKWDRQIEEMIATVDVAYLDATFFEDGEIPGRSMAEIPHPFIVESMERFEPLPAREKRKIRFIHLNHTNPAIFPESEVRRQIEGRRFRVAEEGERVGI